MRILGISAFYHDSAATLIEDERIIAAAQEERFTRKKHDSQFPQQAIAFCLSYAGVSFDQIDFVAFYDKPFLKFERLLETYLAFAPKGFNSFRTSFPTWIKDKLFQKNLILESLAGLSQNSQKFFANKLLFSEHHHSHAASAFFPSPFNEALILTMDGVGEWATTSLAYGQNNKIQIVKEINFPHSLGLLYSAFTYFLGFKVNSGEYKVMGLAPYGRPRFKDLILKELVDLKEDGSYRLNMKFFNYCTGLTMTNHHFHQLFQMEPRLPEDHLQQVHMDLAASIQAACEVIILKIGQSLQKEYGCPNLCLAGGVALNCVANGKLLKKGFFKNIWIQPAAGDSGGSLGAAWSAYYEHLKRPRTTQSINHSIVDSMQGSYLGPEFSQKEIEGRLDAVKANYQIHDRPDLLSKTAEILEKGSAIGWFQGRMEFGPRALGARSILADPRSPSLQKDLNLKIKFRESFRPFAPAVLREDLDKWFDLQVDSPYMLLVGNILNHHCHPLSKEQEEYEGLEKLYLHRSKLPAITHVDYSARVQTVHREKSPLFYDLIAEFKKRTQCPVLINTSFNIRGEPIVCTPEDAFRCFMGTGLDALIIGQCLLIKNEQDSSLVKNYLNEFALD